jgi:WD repeat-containing protein 35
MSAEKYEVNDDEEEMAASGEEDSEDKESSQFSESSEEEDDASDTGLTENQNRLLYMVSLYTNIAQSDEEAEEWIRKSALLVMTYEGIVQQVFDYDYAPASMSVENRRKYFNMSQEGRSDVDFLREEELINGLKLSSKTYQPVTCFQISEKGAELCGKLSKSDRQAVQELVFAPGTRNLLQVEWDGEKYWLRADGYQRESTVTDTEDVSYVASAYVPQCLRHGGRPTLSNAHRAHECGISESNIRDELDEVVTLNSVSIVVAEFIPFGANQVVSMNTNMGSTERVQGGFFTALMDDDESGTGFQVPPGLTSVNILDYSLTRHINFEADIHFPEAPGIVQVEMFGVSINYTGTCFYGMQIEAVLDRIKDNLSLDHLSRLLVDVHQDSSAIVDSTLSAFQRQLMNLVYLGDAPARDKINLIVANEITPHLTAEEYMDKGEYENELKQVLGDTRAAFDISEHDTLIFGACGLLIAGPNARHHEPLLCSYIAFAALDLFVRNYFSRMFIVMDDMKEASKKITHAQNDPDSLIKIRNMIVNVSRDLILMEEVLKYITEALSIMPVPPEPPEQAGRSLYARLQIMDAKIALGSRVTDLNKNIVGTFHERDLLMQMSNNVAEYQNNLLQYSTDVSLKDLVGVQGVHQRNATVLELMQIFLVGSLSFDILDRVTGEWTVVSTGWMRAFVEPMMKNTPAAYFVYNMFIWALFAFITVRILRNWNKKAAGLITVYEQVNRPIHVSKLDRMLLDKDKSYEEHVKNVTNEYVRVGWREEEKREYGGTKPHIHIEYDKKMEFLLNFKITYPRREVKRSLQFSAQELKAKVYQIFDSANIWRRVKGEDGHDKGGITFGGTKRPERGDNDYLMEKLDEQKKDILPEGDGDE